MFINVHSNLLHSVANEMGNFRCFKSKNKIELNSKTSASGRIGLSTLLLLQIATWLKNGRVVRLLKSNGLYILENKLEKESGESSSLSNNVSVKIWFKIYLFLILFGNTS
jgi:hypothetical protein